MRKLLAYPLTILYLTCFGITLLIFHPIQWLCLNIFGYQAHKVSVDALQWCLVRCLHILGTRFTFSNPHQIPTNQPLIIVANHQSMYDISPIMWFMRQHHIKFISKKELGKGIPSVSFNLRHGGSVLIDRKNPRQAVKAIEEFSNYIETTKRAAVIFPEGTRSKTGVPKPFQKKGLLTLFEGIPSALVVPITVNNSWKMLRYGKFPMGIGNHIKFTVHQPISLKGQDPLKLIETVEKQITEAITHD
ncbi:1-acyl-sn-glycerol-3-phosphate acyltransferase [Flavobacteriaceae bacterium MAR_2010_72]|nr:1-acyl-sn-glycerol-3-phosphate acyltransferase [Flavobacteriaceae bacterium MAR_2010_72]TVZ58183.1 1-acyl-sn-glycerol-3-phosphate acyltransferase [Flavobacteriaceae bacterium MAR_2010_105]